MRHVCQLCTSASLALFLHLCPALHPLLCLSLLLQVTGFAPCSDLCLTVMRQKDPRLFSSLNSFNYSHFLSVAVSPPFVSCSFHRLFFFFETNLIFRHFLSQPSHYFLLYTVEADSVLSVSTGICPSFTLSSLTVVEWQAIQARYAGCPFERAAVESNLLPHCLTSSLTAWNNMVLTDTWCILG